MGVIEMDREAIQKLREQAQSLITAAEAMDRGLTDSEMTKIEEIKKEIEKTDANIARNEKALRSSARVHPWSGSGMTEEQWKRQFSGRGDSDRGGVVMLGPAQKVSSLPAFQGARDDGFNLGKAIKGLVSGDWSQAQFEASSLREGDPSSGGYLLPPSVSADVIDLARGESCLIRAGARTVAVPGGTFAWPKITADPVAVWRGEGGSIASTTVPFGRVESKPRSLACIIPLTLELIEDCPNCEGVIRDCLGKAFALELDRAGLFGSGATHEPLGIFYTTGVGSVEMDTNGAAFEGDESPIIDSPVRKILDTIKTSLEHNCKPDTVIMSPRTRIDIEALVNTDGDPLKFPGLWQDMQQLTSTQVSNTLTQGSSDVTSCLIMGGFSTCVLALRSSLRIDIADQAKNSDNLGFDTGHVLIRAILRADWVVQRPADLTILKGILETS